MLADAAAAEARGDKTEAIALLRRAAELYRDGQNHNRALKMLRHIRRLEGIDEPEGLDGGEEVDSAPRKKRVMEERGPTLADPRLEAWCSFCCRPSSEAGSLVGGPTGSFICSGCVGTATGFLGGGAHASVRAANPFAPLPHQEAAFARLRRPDAKLSLLLGPAGSGKSTLLAALQGVTAIEAEQPVTAVPEGQRVVISVKATAPPAPLTIGGQGVYDTATLVVACGDRVAEDVLARVDAVAVLPAFDEAALQVLAERLGVKEAAAQLVALAMKSAHPARELRALVTRLA